MSNTTATAFGNEIDDVLYVSEDFLKQYPDYLDTAFDAAKPASAGNYSDEGPEEGDATPSLYKSQIRVNGRVFIAVQVLMSNPNYLELKYNLGQDVSLPEFIPNGVLGRDGNMYAGSSRRRQMPLDSAIFNQQNEGAEAVS
uniref:Uncharacterized protein n=1 Tax=Candidatus Kentrum sp. TUN TaxID=2126343 RepID=A0A450ZMV3_9GAMM|nr:MAG: hypothetical protein BECKTUN1418F_GA0071002_106310 [Candidatus Kentron sp. TUN]VFK58561.1 MAG: hypothetical protein BECKTUN1418D_GA0071000_108512 [Candidatus Kentron sp. TUN]VFK61067.1 MAG: hypothetical protein BECKTUN1418E_GA0071001_106110 [Candidatus Kentron sp. TUN]